jgi:hypothetical protein
MLGPYLDLMLQFTAATTLPNVVRSTAFDAIVAVVPLLVFVVFVFVFFVFVFVFACC